MSATFLEPTMEAPRSPSALKVATISYGPRGFLKIVNVDLATYEHLPDHRLTTDSIAPTVQCNAKQATTCISAYRVSHELFILLVSLHPTG